MAVAGASVNEATQVRDKAAFDRLVLLAQSIFDAPIVLISVLDGDRAVFRSNVTVSQASVARDTSVSSVVAAMGPGGVLVVENALENARFKDHPFVTGPDQIRFYAGAAVTTSDGRTVGALSVLDRKPRPRPDDRCLDQLKLLAGMAADILDQTAATRVIHEQLGVLKLAEQMSGVGHWRMDPVSQRVEWSDEVYRIHGVTRETFDPSYDDAVAFYHPDDRAEVYHWINRTISTGEGYEFKLRLIRADGDERLVVSRGLAERGADGRPVAVYGVFQDVTEVEGAHRRVVESEARYRLLTETSTDIIARFDPKGRFLYVSPAVQSVLGLDPADMLGKDCTGFIPEDDLTLIRQILTAYVAAGPGAPVPRYEYRARRADGETIWLEATPRAIRDEAGCVVEFHDCVREVTARKALEAELIAARNVAEAAARAKTEFLANMSHELRTPLTSVIGFSALLRNSTVLPETERRYADRIGTASEALLSVINDILDYSKLEADAVGLDPVAFDPVAMIDGAVAMIEAPCRAKGLELLVETAADVPAGLMGDVGRLRQVTLNFLSNAVKFTASGHIGLALSWKGERLRVAVRDSGIGISPERIDALFDRFTQADASTTRLYGGTGLGLAISRHLIDLMGGEIGANSLPGQGSEFWFEVPLIEAVEADPIDKTAVATLPVGTRILMADDAAPNRELVRVILESFGVDLHTVSDGAEAVQAAGETDYDVILMDVHMPVMDGMDATRAIRAMKGPRGGTPILALTANVQPEQVEACRQAGMDGHIGKPISVPELIGTIAACLPAPGDTARSNAA